MLDIEIVALDQDGRSDFELLQQRIHRSHPSADLQTQVPVSLVVFDLLRRDGEDLLTLSCQERREALRSLCLDKHYPVQVPPYFSEISGPDMLAAAAAQGLEGVVANSWARPICRVGAVGRHTATGARPAIPARSSTQRTRTQPGHPSTP